MAVSIKMGARGQRNTKKKEEGCFLFTNGANVL
jgi:hypothetical protein